MAASGSGTCKNISSLILKLNESRWELCYALAGKESRAGHQDLVHSGMSPVNHVK